MKRYLVYQQVVCKKEATSNGGADIDMAVVIRNVGANSEAEAIGKFILQTADLKVVNKLVPSCIELDTLKKID